MGNAGVILAAVGSFEIVVTGKSGHGAIPHTAIDPVACAATIVVALQTIVSRESNPFAPTVVTVASIHGGDAMNVIPDTVRMTGTFRSLSLDELLRVKQRIEDIARRAAEELVGAQSVGRMEPVLGGEDFAFYQQRVPGCFTFIGVSGAEWPARYGVHHEKFKVDEAALPIGAALHVATALEALAPTR
jgi:metal-dependent amidase/aminoacylase/carboxypeptidase family protein